MSDSPNINGRCTHCKAVIAFPAEAVGELADCPGCGRAVVLQPEDSARSVRMPELKQSADVNTIACPKCREPMDEGSQVCVECGFLMPRVIPWVRIGAITLILLQVLYIGVRVSGMDPRVRNELRAALGMSHEKYKPTDIATLKSEKSSSSTEKGEKGNEPYIPGRLEFVRQPAFDLVEGQKYIVGMVKNTSNRDVFYEVRVKFMLQNQARVGLGEIQDYKDWIEPGETWGFRALVLDPDAVAYEFITPILGER